MPDAKLIYFYYIVYYISHVACFVPVILQKQDVQDYIHE